jgi:hypothetical protein
MDRNSEKSQMYRRISTRAMKGKLPVAHTGGRRHFPRDIRDMVLGPSNLNVARTLWIASIEVVLFHAMALYLVSYVLVSPGRNYEPLYLALRNQRAKKVLYYQWVLRTSSIAEHVRDWVKSYTDNNDCILVNELHINWTSWATLTLVISTRFSPGHSPGTCFVSTSVVWRSAVCTSFNAFLSASFSTFRHKESLCQKIFIVAP